MSDAEIIGDILEALSDAVLKLDEASGIAKSEYGDDSPLAQAIEGAWAEVYGVRENLKNGHIGISAAIPARGKR